eukprot:scaffold3725_cov114-Cylindrotheca_fusiformis.AAC.10
MTMVAHQHHHVVVTSGYHRYAKLEFTGKILRFLCRHWITALKISGQIESYHFSSFGRIFTHSYRGYRLADGNARSFVLGLMETPDSSASRCRSVIEFEVGDW